MKNEKVNKAVCALAGALIVMLASGCASVPFQMKSGAKLSPEGMHNLILRAKYPPALASKIPAQTKAKYEESFAKVTNVNVRVTGKDGDPKPAEPYYYLDTEVTKYKPGSAFLRMMMTPVIAFGLWGSYVDVTYSISDPATDTALGNGMIRKSNLWGGSLGGSITSETQLEACPKAIIKSLGSIKKE